jgi:hypothetical protein
MWQQWALFPVGIIIGVLFGLAWANEKITRLRVALGDLVRAVEQSPTLTGLHNRERDRALEKAREVLDL